MFLHAYRYIKSDMSNEPRIISGPGFGGDDPLSANDLKGLVVESLHQAHSLVENWDDELILVPGLTLSDCNSMVKDATPVLLGTIFKDKVKVEANKYWNFDSNIFLVLSPIDLKLFKFTNNMTSDLLDHVELEYYFADELGGEIDQGDMMVEGFEGFSLRAHMHPTTGSLAKLELTLFPVEKETLLKEHQYSDMYVFPGFGLVGFEIDLGLQRDEILDNAYGLPVLPVLKVSNPIRARDRIPSREDLVSAVSCLLRRVTAPEIKCTINGLYKAWAAIKKHGSSALASTSYDVFWPPPPTYTAPEGKKFYLL